MRNPFLVGPTVYLRPLEPEDAPAITPWFNDADVNRFLLRVHPMTVAGEAVFLREVAAKEPDLILGIVVREGERLVGTCGLHQFDPRCRHAAFGIVVGDKAAWGKGYGTEATRLLVGHAFRTLNLNRVWLEAYEYNPRGIRVYEKVGFKPEGRLRQDTFRDGRYWDTLLMGLLREEWDGKEP